ncbi:methyltransferase [Lachnobacterium bovis]|uniref:methyltransferase n=1 Tax=Lachnobacterium bovis TaxID=140626 RepID=UPI000687089B|nr:methyltransferase [Lachnobacterium bovis]
MENTYKKLLEKENVRENLSSLRKFVKEEENKEHLKELINNIEDITQFLKDEDPKSRKNAALLLGDLELQEAKDAIYDAYVKEQILFVKSHYLVALNKLNVEDKIPDLIDILDAKLHEQVETENEKHINNEIAALRKIIIRYQGITRHKFVVKEDKTKVVLTCNRGVRSILKQTLGNVRTGIHPLGVLAETTDLGELLENRTYREVLFPLGLKSLLPEDPKEAAIMLWESGIYDFINKYHEGPEDYYFRVELRNQMNVDERGQFIRKFGTELEKLSKNRLVNSSSDYEIEIRLIGTAEGKYYPSCKFYTLKDRRFDYRKNSISTSIHPSTAALVMKIAERYLKNEAQILDPFCGVGTMLIERTKNVFAREMYGIDVYGQAIEFARENAFLAKERINFINRNYFDFRHDYLFDEIITNMPARTQRVTRRDLDFLYGKFLEKSREVLTRNGIIVMYTNEIGLLKKHLRFHREYRLLQDVPMQDRSDYHVVVLAVVM